MIVADSNMHTSKVENKRAGERGQDPDRPAREKPWPDSQGSYGEDTRQDMGERARAEARDRKSVV